MFTISQLSKTFQISTRTLRYYEQIGLLSSTKIEDYAYRTYDEFAVKRLQQILILRKLRIKLKDISAILDNETTAVALEVFQNNLEEINEELTSLKTIHSIFEKLIVCLKENTELNIYDNLFDDPVLVQTIHSFTPSIIKNREEKLVENLNTANKSLSKLQDKEVRILYLAPSTVASAHFIGESPEDTSGSMLDDFVRKNKLETMKPDLRIYGFNNPCPKNPEEPYGYEFWVTIPKTMNVEKPLIKKYFEGGLYAAYCIKMGNFEEWKLLYDWVNHNDEYVYDRREPFGMDGCMEEHLNAFTYFSTDRQLAKFEQIDLLIPIKPKEI